MYDTHSLGPLTSAPTWARTHTLGSGTGELNVSYQSPPTKVHLVTNSGAP